MLFGEGVAAGAGGIGESEGAGLDGRGARGRRLGGAEDGVVHWGKGHIRDGMWDVFERIKWPERKSEMDLLSCAIGW